MNYQQVIDFWFVETDDKQRFSKDLEFDALVTQRFLASYWQVVRGELEHWRTQPAGRLAEVIVLDQFARNMFRDQAQAFTYDPLALALAQEAVRAGADKELEQKQRMFLYMPYMHSESLLVHERAVELFTDLGIDMTLEYEHKHKVIIERFGRYPHRNAALGRESTPEEVEFVREHGGF